MALGRDRRPDATRGAAGALGVGCGEEPWRCGVTAEAAVVIKALADVCGDVREGRGGGGRAALVASPGSTEEAAAVMRVAAEHGLAVSRAAAGRGCPGAPRPRVRPGRRQGADVRRGRARSRGPGRPGAGRGPDGRRRGRARARPGQEIALDVPGDRHRRRGRRLRARRAAAAALRDAARPADRDHDRAGRRYRREVGRKGRQERRRLRPREAVRRVGGDPRPDHRGDVPAAPAARRPRVRDRRVRRRLRGVRRGRGGGELTARRPPPWN